jgi:hypothetical protein
MTKSFAILAFSLACSLCPSTACSAGPTQVEKYSLHAPSRETPSAFPAKPDTNAPQRAERVASLRKDIEEFAAHCEALKKKEPRSYEGKCSRLIKRKPSKPQ